MHSVQPRRLPNAQTLAKEILGSNEARVDLYDWFAGRLRQMDPDLSEMQALEKAEERMSALRAAVDEILEAKRRRAVTVGFEWMGGPETDTLIRLSSADSQTASDREALRESVLAALLDPGFSNVLFEHVCAFLLDLYGASSGGSAVTRPSGDGGIDFYGIYQPGAASGARRLATQPFRIAGQAKRVTGLVGRDAVELFARRLDKWRAGHGRGWTQLPAWFRDSPLPILGLFVATGGFQSGALLAGTEGIVICLDGETISEDLVESELVAKCTDGTGRGVVAEKVRVFFEARLQGGPE